MLFVHNKDHALFDLSDALGGTYLSVQTAWRSDAPKAKTFVTYSLKLEIIKKIPTEENVCQEMPNENLFDMEQCLARFYALTNKCASPWEKKVQLPGITPCNTSTQFKGIHTELLKFSIKTRGKFSK